MHTMAEDKIDNALEVKRKQWNAKAKIGFAIRRL